MKGDSSGNKVMKQEIQQKNTLNERRNKRNLLRSSKEFF